MSGSTPPKDNSLELYAMEQETARQAREQQAQKEAADRARFEQQLNGAYGGAVDEARNYFVSRGLDPEEYTAAIQRAASSARTKVPDMAASPGTYFDNLGATVYDSERSGQRAKLLRDINSFAGEGFDTRRIGDTTDDATLESILQEQRSTADNYLRNLLDRGVVNSGGYSAGVKNLDDQAYGARARLQEAGNQVLEQGRGTIRNQANTARQRASNFELGESFNPFDTAGTIDASVMDFMSNLGNSVRAKVPSGLFQTSGLPGIAGASMGAQNMKFNPAALAGVNDNKDEEVLRQTLSAF